MKIKNLLFISIFTIIVFTIFFIQKEKTIKIILPDNREINTEIADNIEKITHGLMFREELAENAGMFFIYPEEKELHFWMKNTLIPLDIIFINKDFEILNIEKAEPCKSDPCPSYSSDGMAQYVLEINQSLGLEYKERKIKSKDMSADI